VVSPPSASGRINQQRKVIKMTRPINETFGPYKMKKTKTENFIVYVPETCFEVYPHDLPEPMTYVDTVKAVAKLGDGWRIPTLPELKLMYAQNDKIGGFCTEPSSGSDYPAWYWSSTPDRDSTYYVVSVRFSDGYANWGLKDFIRLSCRPVRLVPAAAPSLG